MECCHRLLRSSRGGLTLFLALVLCLCCRGLCGGPCSLLEPGSSVVSSITGVNTAVFEIINTTTVFGIHCKISKPVQLQYYTIQLILYKSNRARPTSLSLPSTSLSLPLPHPHYHYLYLTLIITTSMSPLIIQTL